MHIRQVRHATQLVAYQAWPEERCTGAENWHSDRAGKRGRRRHWVEVLFDRIVAAVGTDGTN